MNPSPSASPRPHEGTSGSAPSSNPSPAERLESARVWSWRGERYARDSSQCWLHCAIDAYHALDTDDPKLAEAAAALATRSADELFSRLLKSHSDGWSPGLLQVKEVRLQVEFRQLSPNLQPPLRIMRARDVPMDAFSGDRRARAGFGVPLAALSPRAIEMPLGRLVPHSGMFRNLTAWIEPDAQESGAPPHLVLADPQKTDVIAIGAHRLTLASDSSAAYAWAMRISKLERSGLWGLLGGHKIGRRAGLYLLEDYDPDKRPLVMIHGLGSNPLIWSHLSNAVWSAEDLRARFQIWQVIHQTDAPLLVARMRVQDYLDDAWRMLDPAGEASARAGVVLVGHSLGGVVARLLCADSGEALWNAAFLVPPQSLVASSEDREELQRIFSFHPYPGIARAVFLAAPHRGSPGAETALGRLTRDLVGRRAIEVHALRRIAQANPEAVRPEMLRIFQKGWINSITTLQSELPVRRAAESLLPSTGIPYHTIAGVLPGRRQQTDGFVPLASTLIPGAASCLVVESGHGVYKNPHAVAEILRILRQ